MIDLSGWAFPGDFAEATFDEDDDDDDIDDLCSVSPLNSLVASRESEQKERKPEFREGGQTARLKSALEHEGGFNDVYLVIVRALISEAASAKQQSPQRRPVSCSRLLGVSGESGHIDSSGVSLVLRYPASRPE